MNKSTWIQMALVAFAGSPAAYGQTASMCAGLAEAGAWDKSHDAVPAAPGNHRVIYENANVRVLEVTVLPGEREAVHHHQWPSVMVVDARPKYINYDGNGKEIPPAVQAPGSPEMPIMVRLPAQAEHSIYNIDSTPFHAIRIEYKKICEAVKPS